MRKKKEILRNLLEVPKLHFKKAAFLLTFLVGSSAATFAQGTLSTGLVHHYCFEGNADDRVGTNHGTPMGGISLIPSRTPAAGTAYFFDGVDDHIDLPDDVWINGDFTISGWIRVDAQMRFQRFFEFGNGTPSDNVVYSPTPWGGVFATTDAYVVHRNTCVTTPTNQVAVGTLFPLGTWEFVTIVQRGGIGEIWRNSVITGSSIITPACSVLRTQCYFGRSAWGTDQYFSGAMDDIRIYNRALNGNEIVQLYNLDEPCDPFANANCNDTCYWRVEGNNILAPTRNILGTMSNSDVRLFTNGTPRGIYSNTGNFGWNTMTPTAKLHVDVTSSSSTTGIRFQGLLNNSDSNVLTVDAAGNVHTRAYSGGGSTNSCASINFLPKTSTTSGNMTCSQIFDNGTSVGISTTGGFNYISLSGGRLGTLVPPSTGIVRFEVNGVARSLANIVTSDSKFKSNIQSISNSLDIIKQLDGKTYTWNNLAQQTLGADDGLHIGFLAQDLEKVIPEIVIKDNEGNLGVNYTEIIPILTEAIKEQQKQIDELKSALKTNSTASNGFEGINKDGFLAQNVPNPFSVSTNIQYELPKGTENASIGIYDMNGKEIKLIQLSLEKTGNVSIKGGDLMPGMYLYTLIINGKYFDSKKMILTSQ